MVTRRPVLLGLGATLAAWNISAQQPSAVVGTWTGALEVGSQRLRLKFEIASDGTTTRSGVVGQRWSQRQFRTSGMSSPWRSM